MIIRFTIHDNDFSDALKLFARQFYSKIVCRPISVNATTGETITMRKELNRWIELLHDPDELLTPEDKEFVCNCVRIAWNDFADKVDQTYYSIPGLKCTRKYFKENFDVEIVDSFQELWENGEVCYYFTTAQIFIIQ